MLLFIGFGIHGSAQFSQDLEPYKEALTVNKNGGCGFFTATPNPQRPSCNGFTDGQACITPPTGGVGPYTYIWVGSPNTDNCRENVGAGTYSVIIIDNGQGGASCSFDIIVNEPADIAVFTMNAIPPSCFGECDGRANPIVIGGNGGFSFSYSSGETTQLATMLCDPFDLIITDALGCTTDTTYSFLNGPDSIEVASVIVQQQCFGISDGAIDITLSGGAGGYSVTWSGPNGFSSNSQDISGLEPGTYDLSITDANSCPGSASFEIQTATEIEADETILDVVCSGANTGAIELEVSEGAGGYTFSWVGPSGFSSTDEDIFNLFAGTYSVTITDANSCSKTFVYAVDENVPISVTATITDLACSGEPTGAIDITIVAPFPIATTSWTGPNGFTASTEDLTALLDGTYALTITDILGCTKDTTFSVFSPAPLALTAILTDLLCFGDSDGAIDINVTGGDGSYSYTWTGPGAFSAISQDISGLVAGSYTVNIQDGQACPLDSTFVITQPDDILVSSAVNDVECNGEATGSIELEITGGTGSFSFTWTGPGGFTSSDEDIFNLLAGSYDVTLVDDNGCGLTLNFIVDEPTPLLISAIPTDLLCFEDGTGAIDLTVTGGTPVYTISWTGPGGFTSTDQDLTGLQVGTYSVTVTDDNACVQTLDVDVFQPDELLLSDLTTQISCFAADDGAIDLTITGGTGTYTIAWTSPGGFSSAAEDISGLGPDTYTVLVTDQNNCSATLDIDIIEPLEITIDAVVTDLLCNGDASGAIDITVSNGVPGYTFSWTGPAGFTSSSEDISSLIAGTYVVTVTDDNGCQQTENYVITVPSPLTVSGIATDLLCFEDASGAIDLTVIGGTPLYTISWTGPGGFTSTDQDLTGLQAGTYSVTVTDDNACVQTLDVDVFQPDELLLSDLTTQISCFAADDGAIDLTITGGTGTYTIAWTSPGGFSSAAEDISGLGPDTYTVLVTDQNNCSATLDIDIIEPLEITIDAVVTDLLCNGDASGAIDITVSNGVPGYTFSWTGPAGFTSSSEDISSLIAGTYVVTVTDDNGCQQTENYVITVPSPLTVSGIATDLLCFEDASGAIDLTVIGGTPLYTISWTGPGGFSSTDQDLTGLQAGTYSVTVTDDNGCVQTLDLEVEQPDELTLSGVVSDPDCADDSNGSIDITVQGGTLNYAFVWNGPLGFIGNPEDLSNLPGGTYNVTVTDANGCTVSDSFVLTQPDEILITLDISDPNCGFADGEVVANVTGGISASGYQYAWFDSGNTLIGSNDTITGLVAGSYFLTVTDDNGCNAFQFFTLSDANGSVTAAITNVICQPDANGAINITVSDLTPPLNFSWIGPVGFTSSSEDISMLIAGGYTVTIVDDVGCTLVKSFIVGAPQAIFITSNVNNVSCPGDANGSINLSVQGGVGTLSYAWTGPSGFTASSQDLTGLAPGLYTVTVTDANLCQVMEDYVVGNGTNYSLTADISDITCAGDGNGAIDLMITPAISNGTYAWTGPNGFSSTTQDISGLEPGTYSVTLTTPNLCSFNADFIIDSATEIEVVSTVTSSTCGLSIGAVSLSVTGGTVAVDYIYSIFSLPSLTVISTSNSASGLDGGLYGYTVSDDSGCAVTGAFTVSDGVGALTAVISDETCENAMDGAIDITASGLVGSLSFLWSGPNGYSSASQDLTGLAAGVYTVSVTDANGCVIGDSYEVLPAEGILVTATITDVSCFGSDDGAIDLSYSGGVAGYDFDWSGPNGFFSFNEDISGLEPGLYTVSVTDSEGCAGVASFEVEEPSPISVSANVVGVLCNGDDSGTIDITVSGGNGGYAFTWTGPTGFSSAFEDLNGLFSGNYTLNITDIEGCTFSGNYSVNESPAIAITLVDIVDANCNLNNGAIEVSASGGNPSYTYVWTNAGGITVANGPLAQDLPFGTYTVTVTDEDLCQVSDSYSISNVEAGLSAVISDVSCNGFSDGAIDVTVSGFLTGAVDTLWTGPAGFTASTEDISGLIIGTYTLTLSDELGCVFIEDYSVEQPLPLTSSAITTDLSCNGEVDGAIDLSTGGGTGTITVSWIGPNGFTALTEDISGLEGGTYTATLTDENLCTISSDYEVLEPALITATAIIVPVLCNGEFTGAIDLSPLGGIGVRTYAWIGPDGFTAITQNISDLEAGNYLVTITDANGCDEDFSFDVPENDAIDISLVDQEDANCNLLNGSIEVSASGGDSNLSYLWTDAGGLTVSTNALAENLGIGVYTVTVTDGNGCTSETDFEILNQEVSLTGEAFDASCFGEANGSVSITVSGVLVGAVDTLWMGPGGYSSIMGDISGLLAGTYTVTITDAVGCILTDDFIVEEPALLVVTTAPTQNLCNGDLNGSIDAEISGGTLDYTYSWTGPDGFTSSLEDLINLAEGVYSLIVTDENNCIATSDIILTDPDTLAAAVSLIDPSCVGLDDGSIDLEMTGGTGVLDYSWIGPDGFVSSAEDLINLQAGDFLVDVLDENGCSFSFTYTLNVQQVMTISLSGTDISCNDFEDGAISLEVNGGNPDYGFEWSGPDSFTSSSEDLINLAAGDYTLTITDDLGCSLDTLISLNEPTVLEVLDLLSTDLDCFQDGSGSISLSTTGGTPGYTWEWNGPSGFLSTQEDLSGLVAGTYDLTLSDVNDCPLTLSVTLMEPAELTVQAQSIQEAFCQNSPDGSIDVGINGGTPDFAVSWNGPDGFTSNDQNLQDILPGEYTITITDDNDCITSAPFTVGFILDIMADAGTYPPICNGEAIDLDGSGSSEGVDYSWSLVNGTPFSNQVSTTFQATTESDLIVLTVSNGACIDRDTLILDILLLPMPDAGEDITSFVNEAVVLGGDPTWGDASSFSWFPPQNLDNPSSPNPIYINQGTTTFIVTVIDNNGCIATDEIIVTLDPTIEVPDGFTPNGDAYNDGWELANVGLFPGMVVQVFNRWGDELFQSPPGYPEPWDGEYDGSPLPVGTYYYVIELNDPLFPDPITGPLTIFR